VRYQVIPVLNFTVEGQHLLDIQEVVVIFMAKYMVMAQIIVLQDRTQAVAEDPEDKVVVQLAYVETFMEVAEQVLADTLAMAVDQDHVTLEQQALVEAVQLLEKVGLEEVV
jgi:hypothetical protein